MFLHYYKEQCGFGEGKIMSNHDKIVTEAKRMLEEQHTVSVQSKIFL